MVSFMPCIFYHNKKVTFIALISVTKLIPIMFRNLVETHCFVTIFVLDTLGILL